MSDIKESFPNFSGKAEEWTTWSFKVKALITYKHPQLFEAAPATTDASRSAYNAANKWLYLQLAVHLDGMALELVQACPAGEGLEALDRLMQKYDEQTVARQCNLQAKIIMARLSSSQDPTSFFLNLEDDTRRLRTQGIQLPDEFLRNLVLHNLPPAYQPAKTNLLMSDELTWTAFTDRIVAFYSTEIASPDSKPSSRIGGTQALFAAGSCAYCKKPGHHIRQCKERLNKAARMICWNCGKKGHMRSACKAEPKAEQAAFAGELTVTL